MRIFVSPVLLLLFVSTASADIIDFQSLEQANSGFNLVGSSDYVEDGFIVSGTDLGSYGTQDSRFSGSTALMASANSIIGLSRSGGGSFNLDSIELAEANSSPAVTTVTFIGFLTGGGTTSQAFTLDGAAFAAEQFLFDSSFDDVVAVAWIQGDAALGTEHQFDNINVTAIPEPTSIAVVASFGLTCLRRRRRA